MFADEGTDAHDLPPGLEHTIRAIICTSDNPDDFVGRVQQARGEHAAPTNQAHVSHGLAPHPQTGALLYSPLIVLRPHD